LTTEYTEKPQKYTEKKEELPDTKFPENTKSQEISALAAFCRTLRTRLDGLLSWYAYPISTGPLEGMNNKIKTLKRRSYGFRDPTYFRLKILNIHQTRYALVG